jgi:hypothetical protein
MITKIDATIGITVGEEEASFKKTFAQEAINHDLKPYYCFSEKRVVDVGGKKYQADYSIVLKEVE